MIILQGVSKTFPSHEGLVKAIDNVSLEIPDGAFFTFLGPSGCGKSTTLRCIAGLERPDSGVIKIGEEVVYDRAAGTTVPPYKRHIGMVFQSYAIWPHMTVFDNVAYPLKLMKLPRDVIRERVLNAIKTVGLTGLEKRPAPRLSGGQQQRVAVARALVREPAVLLMDEPLSNLDAKLREEMRRELRTLQKNIGVTVVYVTHDQQEALALSDRIAVMDRGALLEIGSPEDIYYRPKTMVAASFVGASNQLTAVVERAENGLACGVAEVGKLLFAWGEEAELALQPGQSVTILIRPEMATLTSSGSSSEESTNAWSGTVKFKIFTGGYTEYIVGLNQIDMKVRLHSSIHFPVGGNVILKVAPEHCLAFPHKLR